MKTVLLALTLLASTNASAIAGTKVVAQQQEPTVILQQEPYAPEVITECSVKASEREVSEGRRHYTMDIYIRMRNRISDDLTISSVVALFFNDEYGNNVAKSKIQMSSVAMNYGTMPYQERRIFDVDDKSDVATQFDSIHSYACAVLHVVPTKPFHGSLSRRGDGNWDAGAAIQNHFDKTPQLIALESSLPQRPNCSTTSIVVARAIKTVKPTFPAVTGVYGSRLIIVDVSLDARGIVTDAKVRVSSRNKALDQAAVDAARSSTYEPELYNCKPRPSDFSFEAQFAFPNKVPVIDDNGNRTDGSTPPPGPTAPPQKVPVIDDHGNRTNGNTPPP